MGYSEITERVLSIILRYREGQKEKKSSDSLNLVITPYYFVLDDIDTGFSIRVSTREDRTIRVTGDPSENEPYSLDISEYSHLGILAEILTLDGIVRVFHPTDIEEDIYRQLHIHQRDKIIDDTLNE